MKRLTMALCAAAMLLLCGCGATKTTTSYYSSETIDLNHEADGSVTVRAFGSGRNGQDAREQAWKNAVRDIIFKGVNIPGNPYMSKPLVTEVNAQEKYEEFFNAFFADKGYYQAFVTTEDKKPLSTQKETNAIQQKRGVTVRVLRSELKKYLTENGILKTL